MKVNTPRTGVGVRTLVERQIRGCDRFLSILKRGSAADALAEPKHRPALTVSGTTGSGHANLAMALCEAFDYQLVGRELLNDVASDLNCQRELFDSLDEKVRSNIALMFESWLRGREIENQEYISALFRAVGTLGEKGGVVILGRGAALILAEKAGLRIHVDAPLVTRIRRIMESRSVSEEEARRFVETKDQDQSKFWRRYFRREFGDPLAFDLTINTDRIEPEGAVPIVARALNERGFALG